MRTLHPKQSLKTCLAEWQVLELTLIEDSELCKELGIHRNTSLRWRTQKSLPFLRISRKVYYRLTDVLVFLNQKPEFKL